MRLNALRHDKRIPEPTLPSTLTEILLFMSSFAPLFGLFALLNSFGQGIPTFVCLGVGACAAGALCLFMRLVHKQSSVSATVERAQARDQDVVAYVVAYLLPFITLGTETWREKGALIIFIAMVGILYVRAGLLYVNPLLALAGYRLFQADLGTGRPLVIISKRRYIPPKTELAFKMITESVCVEAR